MNKKPVWYLQYDKRWAKVPYAVKGKENGTIQTSGCGPTSAAMLLATLIDPKITPVECAQWSMDHGYKWVNQGTAYSYFVPQFAAYGINCRNVGKDHEKVKRALSEGWYAIACMGPGTWTKGGHYIVIWDWDTKVRINDSASTKDKRLNGDPATLKKEVKNYWIIDASKYNKEDDDMLSYEDWKSYMDRYRKELGSAPAPNWAVPHIGACIEAGVLVNAGTEDDPKIDRPGDLITRQEAAVMAAMTLKAVK